MENRYNLMMVKLLTLIMGIFLAVTLPGCNDSIVADMEAEHLRLSNIARQEIQHGLAAYSTRPQPKLFNPAPDITAIDNDTKPDRKLAKSNPLNSVNQDFPDGATYLLK